MGQRGVSSMVQKKKGLGEGKPRDEKKRGTSQDSIHKWGRPHGKKKRKRSPKEGERGGEDVGKKKK